MTLRKRLFWLFGPLLVLVLSSAFVLSQQLILTRFDRQDSALLDTEAKRLRNLLDDNLKRNLDLVNGYGEWDDSYEFMQGGNPDFIRSNMDTEAMRLSNFDFMVFLDMQDQVYAEQWVPPDLPELLVLGDRRPENHLSLRDDILNLGKRLKQNGSSNLKGQFVRVQGVPVVLAMSAISNSEGSLAPLGTLIAGYFIDGERAEQLQSRVNAVLRLLPPDGMPTDWQLLPAPGNGLNPVHISPRRLLDSEHQQRLLLFSNSLGEPELLLELTKDRRLYQDGRQTIAIFLLLSSAIGLLAWLLIYLGLEHWILYRVSRMHREMAAIGPDSPHQRLSDSGRDELGQLAGEANRMLERLEQSEVRDRQILDAIQDGYFELDPTGVILAVNRALCQMLGYSAEELLQHRFDNVLNAEDSQRARQLFTQARDSGENATFAAPFCRRDGSLGYYETRFSLVHDSQGRFSGFRGILRDISAQVAYQNQLLDMAYRDPLTGLGNRKAFAEHLKNALEQAQRQQGQLALLYLDLDRFKEVNDRFGHDTGDALLQKIAERLRNAMRQPDRVYRLGGDEFTLLLQDASREMALKLAERLLTALGTPLQLGAQHIDFVTPSIGIALYPEHAQDPEGLIKSADSAMYEAKRERNRACVYQPEALSSES
ncbi:sensor domain-containing diguanylate cyclase [Aquipseudomonas guryensis]|jgi:diguanylate cyclase (GGDEF)-like protein/PAS domain S-box-containing protein|uniref:Diguanylate cyclase n=1 Tax=Aquipseudomonas guryensis TaxID=2759165 RepID=A0A7W4DCD2_9GAMM|nr:diguanylate cyclase [Pseudomonas guryensis]MBB1519933.1 diguanylate cyclase [Pseudomonas guryensis]